MSDSYQEVMMKKINYIHLREHATTLNEVCGTGIKIISAKKKELVDAIKKVVQDNVDGIPEVIKTFYDLEIRPMYEPEATELGNTMKSMLELAETLGIMADTNLPAKDVEDMLLEHFDGLTDDEWDKLPTEAQKWDGDMGALIKQKNAEKKKPAKPKKKEEKTVVSKTKDEPKADDKTEDKPKKEPKADSKVKDKPKKDKKATESRPDFKFGENTNAAHIMRILKDMFVQSNSEGIKMKDLQDACEAGGVKSSNVRGRVAGVIKYASLPEGGEQLTREGGLIFPKASK